MNTITCASVFWYHRYQVSKRHCFQENVQNQRNLICTALFWFIKTLFSMNSEKLINLLYIWICIAISRKQFYIHFFENLVRGQYLNSILTKITLFKFRTHEIRRCVWWCFMIFYIKIAIIILLVVVKCLKFLYFSLFDHRRVIINLNVLTTYAYLVHSKYISTSILWIKLGLILTL